VAILRAAAFTKTVLKGGRRIELTIAEMLAVLAYLFPTRFLLVGDSLHEPLDLARCLSCRDSAPVIQFEEK
jgi:hypothetical protein